MTCEDNGPWMLLVEVEEYRSDLIYQMTNHETMHGKRKTQHRDVKTEAWYFVTSRIMRKKIMRKNKPRSDLLWSPTWFGEHDICIHTCLRDGNQKGVKNWTRNGLLCWPKCFTEYDIDIHVAEIRTTNLKSPRSDFFFFCKEEDIDLHTYQ